MKPKHVGSPPGDSPEQLLLEPCSGVCPGAKVQPLSTGSRNVPIWVSFGLGVPFGLEGFVGGFQLGAGCRPGTWWEMGHQDGESWSVFRYDQESL